MKTVNLYIEKSVYGGKGLGFLNGKAVFVPYALTGEEIAVSIQTEKKDHAFGTIEKIITPSSERIEPQCPNFMICGGCDYLHVNYGSELDIKKQIVIESLLRIGKIQIKNIPPIEIISKERFHYRSHGLVRKNRDETGFFKRDSNELVPFPGQGCLLLSKRIVNGLLRGVQCSLNEFKVAEDHEGTLVFSFDDNRVVKEIIEGIVYERDIEKFFQANKFLRSLMLNKIYGFTELRESDSFLDAACGVGFFSLYLSKSGAKGIGIDIDKESIKWARINAKTNQSDIQFDSLSITGIPSRNFDAHTVLIDPPRSGISKKGVLALLSNTPKKIVYVSCNPATFARDVKCFLEEEYSLKKLTIIDMFPATSHIEVIGVLEPVLRRSADTEEKEQVI